ncbi:MAG: hypothetical protein H7Z40_01835 [Phycisphaerae bacterium]|nr:hypothetical protein [Gemmatimonadaceae bacterium]
MEAARRGGPVSDHKSINQNMRGKTPDTSFVLTADLRQRLAPHFDADSLETLLQWLPPDDRAAYLAPFLPPIDSPLPEPSSEMDVNAPNTIPDFRILSRVGDSVLQELVDQVWQPCWDNYSDADLARTDESIPGLEMARKRRAQLGA